MIRRTFAELYCERKGISIDDYSKEVLWAGLYLHARPLAVLINLVHRDYFAPDRDFVEDVGRLRHYHDFIGSGLDFSHHPENRGFLRSVLKVRVSTEKMRQLVKSHLREKETAHPDLADKGTLEPFHNERIKAGDEVEESGR